MTQTQRTAYPLARLPERVVLREVGPRDGLQNEPVILTTDQKVRLIDCLSETGLQYIEVGSFVHPKVVPQMADTAEVFSRIKRRPGVVYSAIAPNAKGAERAIAAGADAVQVFLSASESHNKSNVNMQIAESLQAATEIAATLNGSGVTFEAVISVVFGCPFEGDVPLEQSFSIVEKLLQIGAQQITLGDTTGMANPRLVQYVFTAFFERFPGVPVRFHPHSARGAGIANALAALQVGVDRIDASIGGIGGCPFAPGARGNICSEDLTHMLHEMGVETGIELPRLVECARMIEEMIGRQVPGQTLRSGICGHIPDGAPNPVCRELAAL